MKKLCSVLESKTKENCNIFIFFCRYKIYLNYNETHYQDTSVIEEEFKSGGVYIVYIYQTSSDSRNVSNEIKRKKLLRYD